MMLNEHLLTLIKVPNYDTPIYILFLHLVISRNAGWDPWKKKSCLVIKLATQKKFSEKKLSEKKFS